MRSARLLGRDHHSLGALAAISEGPVAITLSRGGAVKRYAHTEPNEDAVLFATTERGTLIAVADGHSGASGAQTVIDYLAEEWAARWIGTAPGADVEARWRDDARRALGGANHAVLAEAAHAGRPPAPTTLAFAVLRRDAGVWLWAGIGDSHVFAVDTMRAVDVLEAPLAEQRKAFFGYEAMSAEALAQRTSVGHAPAAALLALVLATDGLSESGIGVEAPASTVHALTRACSGVDPELRPLELARRVGAEALAAHRRHDAGDNIATAVVWAGD